jgi:peptide/nickel transport system permease protein
MTRIVLTRLAQLVPMLLIMATLLFVLLHITPGGPIVALAGDFADADTVKLIESQLGLDLPLHEQYLRFLRNLLAGDLGQSFFYKAPVLDVIVSRLPATLVLVAPSLALSCVIGVPLGVFATREGSAQKIVLLILLIMLAMPVFWLGHLLRLNLSNGLGLLPVQGMTDARVESTGFAHIVDVARHAALPVLTLTLHQLGFIVLLTRSSVGAAKARLFFRTAMAKGNSRTRAEFVHALPNGSLPIVTLFAQWTGWFITGAVLVETVFAWPGLGQLVTGAIANRDHPLVIGVVLFATVTTLIANLLADVYGLWLDPQLSEKRGVQ